MGDSLAAPPGTRAAGLLWSDASRWFLLCMRLVALSTHLGDRFEAARHHLLQREGVHAGLMLTQTLLSGLADSALANTRDSGVWAAV